VKVGKLMCRAALCLWISNVQGKEGLSRLQAALQSHDILLCCVCGKDALASPDIFSYDEQGHLYCPADFPVVECV
jgi:hypothetical protein